MKFLNKYELLEPVTNGAVETFVATEIASGERVIVHMFAGSEVLPDTPALQWALQSLRGLAPTPMGSVIEGGRYEQTSHAYLVTKFPADPVALQHWIRFYTMQAEATQPTLGTPVPGFPAKAQLAYDKAKQPVGEFTKAFFGSATADVDSQSTSASGELVENKTVPDPADKWSRKPAGAFTKEFLSGFDLTAELKKPAGPAAAPKESRKPQSFTAEFLMPGNEGRRSEEKTPAPPKNDLISALFAAQAPASTASSPTAESQKTMDEVLDSSAPAGKAGTGEFTKFFRGPFGGQSTSGTPAGMNVTPPPRPREKAGEFTQLFGSAAKAPPPNESGALLEPAAPRQPGNFTQLLGTAKADTAGKPDSSASGPSPFDSEIPWNQPMQSQAPRSDTSFVSGERDRAATFREPGGPAPGSAPSRSGGDSTALFANEIAWDRPAPRPPATARFGSAEEIAPNSPTASPAGKSGATSVFTPAGAGGSAAPLPLPSGPSEYTRIISPPRAAPPEALKPPTAAPAAPAFSLPQVPVAVAPMPHAKVPAMSQPQAPQAPHLQYPQMPQPQPMQMPMPAIQSPQVPAAPQAPQVSGAAAAPQKFPYWPLIIVMNVLLIVAVALILYFALKH